MPSEFLTSTYVLFSCIKNFQKVWTFLSPNLSLTVAWSPNLWSLTLGIILHVSANSDLSLSHRISGEGNGNPLQYSCLENPMDGGAWKAAVHGVAKSRTRLSDVTFTFHFHDWRRQWQPTPVFLPGESQGQRSLVGCHLWGRTELDMTEVT